MAIWRFLAALRNAYGTLISGQTISIRLDQNLIDYFKAQGLGYHRRINAVLRSYVKQRKTG